MTDDPIRHLINVTRTRRDAENALHAAFNACLRVDPRTNRYHSTPDLRLIRNAVSPTAVADAAYHVMRYFDPCSESTIDDLVDMIHSY